MPQHRTQNAANSAADFLTRCFAPGGDSSIADAHVEEGSQAGHVFFAQINPALLGAAACASGLAGETHGLDSTA